MPKVKKQKAIFVKPSLARPLTAGGTSSHKTPRTACVQKAPDTWKCAAVIDQQSAEAVAKLLAAAETRTSGATIKSLTLAPHIVHKKPTFAVTCETLKHLPLLKQLLSKVDLLQQHQQLSQSNVYVLVYELLFGQGFRKRGPAEQAVLKQQDALQAALQSVLQQSGVSDAASWLSQQQQDDQIKHQKPVQHPRYARVNTLKATVTDVLQQLQQEFSSAAAPAAQDANSGPPSLYADKKRRTLKSGPVTEDEIAVQPATSEKDAAGCSLVRVDDLLPDVLVLPAGTDLHDHLLVKQGVLVLQSKASCMPAHALRPQAGWHVVDCCAAPGNKTTHVAALLQAAHTGSSSSDDKESPGQGGKRKSQGDVRVFAFDKDPKRLKRLKANVLLTGAQDIITAAQADFLSLDPTAPQFSKVQGVILDPSCSGSGTIVSRMDHLLPKAAAADSPNEQQQHDQQEQQRIEQLAKFQEAAILHALKFPALKRLVYSTCSVHQRENEDVVARVLPAATELGFLLVNPFPEWHRTGLPVVEGSEKLIRTDPYLDATDGFFVTVFERPSRIL